MKKTNTIFLAFALVAFVSGLAVAQTTNLLSKASRGDWAQYAVTADNATVPFMSLKDQQRWRVASVVQETGVRIDNYTFMAGDRRSMGPSFLFFNKPFEPVFELTTGAKIDVISSTPESLTVKGKPYACTKIVRKVSRKVDEATLQTGWNGTSTIWICPDIPIGGLVKIENQYVSQLTVDAEPQKINETWVLVDFGFKDWKEETKP